MNILETAPEDIRRFVVARLFDLCTQRHTFGRVTVAIAMTLSLVTLGCGVTVRSVIAASSSLLLSAPSSSLRAGQQLALHVTSSSTATVNFSLSCGSGSCGQMIGSTFVAPPTVPSDEIVTVTATLSGSETIQSSLTLQIQNPIPVIDSISPQQITAGKPQPVNIHGAGFTSSTRALFSSTAAGSRLATSFAVIDANNGVATVTLGQLSSGRLSLQLSNPAPGSATSNSVTIPVIAPPLTPVTMPTFYVADHGASGSPVSINCSGQSGTNSLSCAGDVDDFKIGQGLMLQGGGIAPMTTALTTPPQVTPHPASPNGSHRYCYVVFTVDPLDGISPPSPQTCIENEPALSYLSTWNSLQTDTSSVGPSPTFLWYVSMDGGDFALTGAQGFTSDAMDVGQRPVTRGGWPTSLPVADYDISKNEDLFTTITNVDKNNILVADQLTSNLHNALVLHDDTKAAQDTIDAAVAAGGGIVQFGAGVFSIRRPSFIYVANNSAAYPSYTTDLGMDPWWAQFSRLHISNGSTGHIHLQGQGGATVLSTPADHGADVTLLAVGNFQRPDQQTTGRFQISDVAKGSRQVTITSALNGGSLSKGDDVWLYSGSYTGTPCFPTDGTSGQCHFSELNTVTAVDGMTVTLAFPTSKRYYDDGSSSFGMVKMPVTPHDIALANMSVNTFDPITFTGLVYGMLVDHVTINGYISQKVFGGGYKRDVVIRNSSWGFGTGDASYGATDEFDQFTNVTFLNNTIRGYAASGAEGPSLLARIYATEGSSQITYSGNHFINVGLYFDQTTDDVVVGNDFINGVINAGLAYGDQAAPYDYGYKHDPSFVSFGSQTSVVVSSNSISDDATFVPPYIIRTGHFETSSVDHNVITYMGSRTLPGIVSYSGNVTDNSVIISGSMGSVGVALVGDQAINSPAAPFVVEGNALSIANGASDIYIPDPGFTDTAAICLSNNILNLPMAQQVTIVNADSVLLSCSGK